MGVFVYSKKAPKVTRRLWDETMNELAFANVESIIHTLSSS